MAKPKNNSNNQGVARRDVMAAERATMAISLLKQRLSYDEIALKCGYSSRSAAWTAIQRELKRRIVPNIDEYRKQELDILDEIHQKVWQVAFETENDEKEKKTNLWAVDRLLELSKDRRKLLNLDVKPEDINASQVVIREVPIGLLPVAKVVEASDEYGN
jgi:AraC-like DNA-binding protein